MHAVLMKKERNEGTSVHAVFIKKERNEGTSMHSVLITCRQDMAGTEWGRSFVIIIKTFQRDADRYV